MQGNSLFQKPSNAQSPSSIELDSVEAYEIRFNQTNKNTIYINIRSESGRLHDESKFRGRTVIFQVCAKPIYNMTKLSTAYAMFSRQLHFLALTLCDTQHLRRGRDAGTADRKSTTPVPSKRVRKHGGLTRLPLLEVRDIFHLEYILTRYHK